MESASLKQTIPNKWHLSQSEKDQKTLIISGRIMAAKIFFKLRSDPSAVFEIFERYTVPIAALNTLPMAAR